MADKNKDVDGYNARHLSQLIRRKMIQKDHGDNSNYTRKTKHKKDHGGKEEE